MKKTFVLLIIILFFLIGCAKTTWQGVYYPNGCLLCEDDYIFSRVYSTSEECLNWAKVKFNSRNNPNDLYECGKNCKTDDYGLMICDETID